MYVSSLLLSCRVMAILKETSEISLSSLHMGLAKSINLREVVNVKNYRITTETVSELKFRTGEINLLRKVV